MKSLFLVCLAVLSGFTPAVFGQIPNAALVQIVRSEDERRFDRSLENLLKSPNAKIRERAAIAAGRIGDERSIPMLVGLLENDSSVVQAAAAFAIGEIESAAGAEAIIEALKTRDKMDVVRARATEAAGKIAAAVAQTDKKLAEDLGAAILSALDNESIRPKPDYQIIRLGITAVLRARPANGEFITAKFLTSPEARVRADAANTLARLRAENANEQLRKLLGADLDPVVRANAARALGAAEDQDSMNLLLSAAASDPDQRVRVSSIRALASLKDPKPADKLLTRAESLLAAYKRSKFDEPIEKSELLEIATALGRILPNSNHARAVTFLGEFRERERFRSPEIEIAFARVSPKLYLENENLIKINFDAAKNKVSADWRAVASIAQGIGEIANLEAGAEAQVLRQKSAAALVLVVENPMGMKGYDEVLAPAMPDVLRAYAQFKTADLADVLRPQLKAGDVIVRATAVELLGALPPEQISFADFEDSFRRAVEDERLNDALMATIEAIGKQKTERAADFLKDRFYFLEKLDPRNGTSKYLARRRIAALLKEKDAGDFSQRIGKTDSIFTTADYVRAVSRRQARAVLSTAKGNFTIEFFPAEAPLAVDNFIKLAKAKYFDGLTIHRVVPNFVMQDGDPRGDGNGGPGWEIRCEINELPYERGAVGMALSGKDTGGSQWFVTHSRQPHLDGGYTVFGQVNAEGMKIVDTLVRGDKILSVRIVEGGLPQRIRSAQKKTK